MTSRPWSESLRGPAGALGTEHAPAYLPIDRAFALVNDYGTGRALLWRGPAPAEANEVATLWRRAAEAPRPHRVAPEEVVEGYGVFTFPYGPISMGVPESGRFDVRTYGERILTLGPVAGFKSRRILGALPGLTPEDALLRVERLAGNFSAAHAAAFLAAVESAAAIEVARTELWTRALAQELERIYNHLHQIARVAEAASQNVGLAQTHALAEEMLRIEGRTFGHRWLFGALAPGAPTRRLDPEGRRWLGRALRELSGRFEVLLELFLGSRTFVDRLQTTGVVSRERAVRWGAVGPVLRATGVAWDDRLRAPSVPYTDLFLELPREDGGDALARILVRAHEVRSSALLLEQLLDRWPGDAMAREAPAPPVGPGRGLGRVESPSGDLVYEVRLTNGRIASVGMRSASHANWPVFAESLRHAVFTDFHFAWESFGLVFAETDA